MKSSIVLWLILAIFGIFGALTLSALFFGFFTLGIFLIFYDLNVERRSPVLKQTSPLPTLSESVRASTVTCPNCGAVLRGETAFCPQCGWKVKV